MKTFCGDWVGPSEDVEAQERKKSAATGNKSPLLTLRRLMSYIYIYIYIYIYGAPILDVSRSHNDAAPSVGLLWTSDQIVAETST